MNENHNVQTTNPSLLGMVTNPKEQFEKIRDNPKIWGALIVISLIFVIGTMFQMSNVDPNVLIDEELEGLFGPGEEKIVHMLSIIGGGFAALFMPIIIILVSTVIYWIIAKLVKSEVTFKKLFSMNTYIVFINAIGVLVNGAFSAVIGNNVNIMFTSLGSFVNTNTMLGAILSNFELFAIWTLILTAIGLQIVAKFSQRAAWTVTILLFVIGIIFSMVGAAFGMLVGTL